MSPKPKTRIKNDDGSSFETCITFRRAAKELPKDVVAALGRNAPFLIKMINRRGEAETAHYLIDKGTPSKTFRDLKNQGYLELAVEAFVLDNPQWHALFPKDILVKAEKRLLEHGYTPKAQVRI